MVDRESAAGLTTSERAAPATANPRIPQKPREIEAPPGHGRMVLAQVRQIRGQRELEQFLARGKSPRDWRTMARFDPAVESNREAIFCKVSGPCLN